MLTAASLAALAVARVAAAFVVCVVVLVCVAVVVCVPDRLAHCPGCTGITSLKQGQETEGGKEQQ